MAFLWLSKFISCNRSKKVSKVYLGTTVALATSVELTLRSLILSHIYKDLNGLITIKNKKLNRTARSLIWMAQIWLVAYHSNVSY